MKFIHLTDTHVQASEPIYGTNPVLRLAEAVASVNEEHGDAAFVIVTGDLTHFGDAASYAAFRSEISQLKMPVHLMVGNHDKSQALIETFPDAPLDADGFVQAGFLTSGVRMLLLDTTVDGNGAGVYCETRRDWLRGQLEIDDAPIFLFMHHPPFPVGIRGMDAIALKNPDEFHALIAPHKTRIRHLFFGHLHRAVWGSWQGIPFSCMRGLNHQVALDLNGSEHDVMGSAEPPAYGVVLIGDDQVTVHMHDYTNGALNWTL